VITPDYCVTMARYNQWQNNELRDQVKVIRDADLRQDRGAFFGSIFGTMNHILWGDRLWLHRLDPSIEAPNLEVSHLEATKTPTEWAAERFRVDGIIREWARRLKSIDLTSDIGWFSKFYQKEFHHLKTLCITHMFNYQTHHRGQIHAMLTAAGQKTIDTDLIFMPES
jgi:uncharacterized damage-inducible protein DinB